MKKVDDGEDMLRMELAAFLKAVIDDGPVAVTVRDGAEALRVALEVERIGSESAQKMLGTGPI